MQILDGKLVSEALSKEIASEVAAIKARGERVPHLVAVLVGNNPASLAYVGSKEKKCKALGMESTIVRLPETISQTELLGEIEKLNNDPGVDGFIVQLPLPKHIDEQLITNAVRPDKDVDGFHPTNLGRLMLGLPTYQPATPMGIVELLRYYKIPTRGKHLVVLGRSHIVGLPVANMMVQKTDPGDCTVTICHSRTQNLPEVLRSADILIVAMGVPEFVKGDMVREGAVVVDVGINRVEDPKSPKGYRLVGDVAYDEVAPKCSHITPVPGGVGPMTIISLVKNTLLARKGL